MEEKYLSEREQWRRELRHSFYALLGFFLAMEAGVIALIIFLFKK